MISEAQAAQFARDWIEAWNTRDLARILSHYTEDFEMTSPLITMFLGDPTGTMKGKANVRPYWEQALAMLSELRFELLDVLVGVGSIALYYRSVFGKKAVEVFFFNDEGKVTRAIAHYDKL